MHPKFSLRLLPPLLLRPSSRITLLVPLPQPGACGLRASAPLRVHRCVPVPWHPGQAGGKDAPVLCRARPLLGPLGCGWATCAWAALSQFSSLCIFARKMLTLPNKPLCSSNLFCLTFDTPHYQCLPPLLVRPRAPGKGLSPGARERMRPAFHPVCRQMDRLSLGQSFGK